MLTPVPAMEAGRGLRGAEAGRRSTPAALDSALPGREPGVVSPDRVSVYIDRYVQTDGSTRGVRRAMDCVVCDDICMFVMCMMLE